MFVCVCDNSYSNRLYFNFFTVFFHRGDTVMVEPKVLVLFFGFCPYWIMFSLCLYVVTVWPIHVIVNVLNSKAGSGARRPTCLQHGHTVYCSAGRTWYQTFPIQLAVLHPSPQRLHSKDYSFPSHPCALLRHRGGRVGRTWYCVCVCPPTSPPAVFYSCLVLWCVCVHVSICAYCGSHALALDWTQDVAHRNLLLSNPCVDKTVRGPLLL